MDTPAALATRQRRTRSRRIAVTLPQKRAIYEAARASGGELAFPPRFHRAECSIPSRRQRLTGSGLPTAIHSEPPRGRTRAVGQRPRETVRETVNLAANRESAPLVSLEGSSSGSTSARKPVPTPNSVNGAAQESNLPSRGLHDRTGFEDQHDSAQPSLLARPRASPGASRGRTPTLISGMRCPARARWVNQFEAGRLPVVRAPVLVGGDRAAAGR
jgi:hypothetical protein